MEGFFHWFEMHFPFLIDHPYLFIFLGATIEGLNTIILCGFLVSIGSVLLVPALLICIAGEVLNGFLWYAVGYFGGAKPIDKWGRKDVKSRKIIETVEQYFHRYSGRAVMLAKLTWSLTIATMIMAGSFKYNLRKFGFYNLIGSIGWVALLFYVGFFFGKSYKAIFVVTRIGYVFLFLACAIAVIYTLRYIFRSRFINSLVLMEKLRGIGDRFKEGIDRMMSSGDR